MRNRPWSKIELILALELYRNISPRAPDPRSAVVRNLSTRLRELHSLSPDEFIEFRSPASVVMKLMNFRSLDPEYNGKGLSSASELDKKIWAEFADRHSLSAEILSNERVLQKITQERFVSSNDVATEGAVTFNLHLERERNRALVARKKAQAFIRYGKLACEACSFDFAERYGERGVGMIECHHAIPLSSSCDIRETRLDDLILLCSNCHAVVHSRNPWLSLAELRVILNCVSGAGIANRR